MPAHGAARSEPRAHDRAGEPQAGSGGLRAHRLTLEVERLAGPTPAYRVTSMRMPGWAAVTRSPVELARTVAQMWRHAESAPTVEDPHPADPRSSGPRRRHLAAVPDEPDEPTRRQSQLPNGARWGTERYLLRPDVADPAAWTVLPNGRLMAPPNPEKPGARRLTYGPDTTMGRRVLERRRAVGLPVEA